MEHLQILEKLLEHGANVNARDKRGFTTLHCCYISDNPPNNEIVLSILKLLLEKVADIKAKCKLGRSLLVYCVTQGDLAIIKFLVKHALCQMLRTMME